MGLGQKPPGIKSPSLTDTKDIRPAFAPIRDEATIPLQAPTLLQGDPTCVDPE